MFHISKKNKRAVCRAVVYGCPLGAERTLMDSFGIVGPARPTVVEAKESGSFDKFYGEEKVKQDKYKQKRKSKKETLQDENSLNYLMKLDEVKGVINSHNEKHKDYLDNSYGGYLMANQKISNSDMEFLDSLDNVGDGVNALVAEKIVNDDSIIKDRELYESELSIADNELNNLLDERSADLKVITDNYRSKEIAYGRYSFLWDKTVDSYKDKVYAAKMKKFNIKADYMVKYEASYGKAYKDVLSDVGVSFSNSNIESLINNSDNISEDFKNEMTDAVSYYPDSWVSNVESDLSVNRKGTQGMGGHISHMEGKRYLDSGKRINLFSADRSTSVHEFGHVLEVNNKNIGRAERLFLLSERKHSSFKKVEKVSKTQNTLTDSMVRKYSGVYYAGGSSKSDNYDGNCYEVFTTGVQSLFTGDEGGFTTDINCKAYRHRNFILGLFATS